MKPRRTGLDVDLDRLARGQVPEEEPEIEDRDDAGRLLRQDPRDKPGGAGARWYSPFRDVGEER